MYHNNNYSGDWVAKYAYQHQFFLMSISIKSQIVPLRAQILFLLVKIFFFLVLINISE